MKENVLRVLNVVTTTSTILLFEVYTLTSLIYVDSFGSNWPRVIMILFYMLLSVVGFLGGLVQGIRTITKGRAGTIKWASIFQLVMFVPFMISACMIRVAIRNYSNVSEIKKYTAFIVIFLIINAILIVKLVMVKGCSRLMVVAETSKMTAWGTVGLIIVPQIAMVVGAILIGKYPVIGRVFSLSFAVIYLISIICFVRKIIEKYRCFKISIELDRRYEKAYQNITGYIPDVSGRMIIKDEQKRMEVERLKANMKNEAERRGVNDLTLYF